MRQVRRVVAAVFVGASIAWPGGCSLLGDPAPVPFPEGCGSLGFSQRRCEGIVEQARRDAPADPVGVALMGPEAGSVELGGYGVARVVFSYATGATVVAPVWCIGIPNGPDDAACIEPALGLRWVVDHDVPCSVEPPEGCPSPITPDAAAIAEARPLRIDTLDVPIDGTGHVEIRLGPAGLPNGYVTRIGAQIVNDQPDDFWLHDEILLDLRPDHPGRPPFGNGYQRPLVDGVEKASLWLVFDVAEAAPGAVLHLADIVVE